MQDGLRKFSQPTVATSCLVAFLPFQPECSATIET